jgi:hypothetical protein
MMDTRGLAFLTFTGMGVIFGAVAGLILGGATALFGAAFFPVALFSFAFCVAVFAVAGLIVEVC